MSLHANHSGCKHATIEAEGLGDIRKLNGEKFDVCDFFGPFTGHVFNECVFEFCDFGLSRWKYAKFRRCVFKKCSFTQATFLYCEFRACEWIETGLSGNETHIPSTIISNPEKFIESAYTNLDADVLKLWNAPFYYQKVRLQRSKANVARKVLIALSSGGEEAWYYEAVKVYTTSNFRAYEYESALEFVNAKSLFRKIYWGSSVAVFHLERRTVSGLGFLNNWGASLVRPCGIGVVIILTYTIIYRHFGIAHGWFLAFVSSAEVTFLAGYTKHAMLNDSVFFRRFIYRTCYWARFGLRPWFQL